MLLGTVTAAAAYAARWSRNFAQGMYASEVQRQKADESGLAANPSGEKARASANGVTITDIAPDGTFDVSRRLHSLYPEDLG